MRRQFNRISAMCVGLMFAVGCSNEVPSTPDAQRPPKTVAVQADTPSSRTETSIATNASPAEVVVKTTPISEVPVSE